MASPQDNISMALFCDFENVALGVRDANYDKFDIKRVLERLLLKGSIVVKKSYCDWDRYKGFKAAMHEANFELIEIPHVRQSGKNSADIRLVVDALDLCYTKSHVNTFVIISGDSDFSPLVSKLRENAKYVIGVGVKNSTSDLLIANCDEFIFYDDLVRESQRQAARRDTRENREPPQTRRTPEEEARRREELDMRRTKAVEMAAETYEALVTDRDEGGRIWASVLKEAIKRRNPGFNENYYGFRTFGNLLEEAKARGLLEFGRDEKSSAFVFRGTGVSTRTDVAPVDAAAPRAPHEAREPREGRDTREAREGRDSREGRDKREPRQAAPEREEDQAADTSGPRSSPTPDASSAPGGRSARGGRGGRRGGRSRDAAGQEGQGQDNAAPVQAAAEADAGRAPGRHQRSPFYPDAVATAEAAPAPRQADESGQAEPARRPRREAPSAAPGHEEGQAAVETAGAANASSPARGGRSERKPAAKKAARPGGARTRSGKAASGEASAPAEATDAAPRTQAASAAPADTAVQGDGAAPAAKKTRSRRPRTSKPAASEG